MKHMPTEAHGLTITVAHNAVGSVSLCECGVLTLTMNYMSLRLEPVALCELSALLVQACRHLDGEHGAASARSADDDSRPVH